MEIEIHKKIMSLGAGDNRISDIQELSEVSSSNRKIFQILAALEKRMRVTSVDRMQTRLDGGVPRADIVALFKSLESLGLCEFIVGRRGKSSRVRWLYDCREVASVALRGAPPLSVSGSVVSSDSNSFTSGVGMVRIPVRPGYAIELPEDLTAAEAGRLAAIVKELPFYGDGGKANETEGSMSR